MVTGGVCHLYRWSPLSVPVGLRTRLAQGAEGAEAALKLGCDGWELPKTRWEPINWRNIYGLSMEYLQNIMVFNGRDQERMKIGGTYHG